MSGPGASPPQDDPIEAYLDRLLVALPGSARHVRHTLSEVEGHLLDATAEGRARGLEEVAARAEAVRRMGPITQAAGRSRLGLRLTPARRRRGALAVLLIGAVGGIAIGIGGVIGASARAVWGDHAIATPFAKGSYSTTDCRRWLAGYPSAHDCVTAMTADHADDFLRDAAVAGILGVLALAGYLWLRRRRTDPALARAVPRGSDLLTGAVLAVLAATVLVAKGVDAILVTRGNGAGQPLSLAAAALLAAGFFGLRARSVLRAPPP